VLAAEPVVTFLIATDRDRARSFYRDTLKLKYISEDPFALVFELHGGVGLRISPVPSFTPAKNTVLGWQVTDISGKMAELRAAGIQFNNYGFPGQDENGLWTTPEGSKVAWFQDPDGNVLSLSQHSA
jgi:catechol 2,3-dioxygenase-like lactoylglutathione lyase family enzyme